VSDPLQYEIWLTVKDPSIDPEIADTAGVRKAGLFG